MMQNASASEFPDGNRDPLPAGHPITWALITAGTCLDGSPYGLPVTRRPHIAADA